jgi:hypothetical protein
MANDNQTRGNLPAKILLPTPQASPISQWQPPDLKAACKLGPGLNYGGKEGAG